MRSQNNMSVSLRIDASTEMSKKFVDFVNSEECDKLCEAALANPKGREAQILKSKIRPLIQICGSRTKWCPFERAACKGKLFSMAQIFSPHSLFMTVSPKALDCLLVIKNAAIQRGFTDEDIEAVRGPTGLNARVRLVSENPVAQARAFQHLIDGFLTIIVGYDETKPNNKGIFGTPLSHFGPVEAQHRGGLHLHLEAQMKELRPGLMQRFAKDSVVRKAFVNYINSIVTGSTRGFEHIEIAARQEREKKSHCGSAPVLWKPAIDFTESGSVHILVLVRISSNCINACETFFDSYINGSTFDSYINGPTFDSITSCRTTRLCLHKLKLISADSTTHCETLLEKGDRVIKCANGRRGVFLGFVNVSTCATNIPLKRGAASDRIGRGQGGHIVELWLVQK